MADPRPGTRKLLKPYISIVTAARNAEKTVEATLASVKAAKTPSTEYLFIDGASTDATCSIAEGYSDTIDTFVSEHDEGQYHAIAKGLQASQGDIQGWINADDVLMPWSLKTVEVLFKRFPAVDWITGLPSFLDSSGAMVSIHGKPAVYPRQLVARGWFDRKHGGFLQQESMFWRRSLYEKVGGLDLSLSLAADFDLWTKFSGYAQLIPVKIPLAAFRELPGQQRSSLGADVYDREVALIQSKVRRQQRPFTIFSGLSRPLRSLSRFFVFGRGPLLNYSRELQEWQLTTRVRNTSRLHLGDLFESILKGRC